MASADDKTRVVAALDYLRGHDHYYQFDDKERVVEVAITDGANVDEIAAHLCNLRDLERLRFCGTGISDEVLSRLAGLARLSVLWIEGPGVTSTGLAHLGRMPKLKEVSIDNAGGLDLAAFAGLASVPSLRKVTLSGGKFSDADLAPLAALNHLEELSLSECNEVHGTFCRYVSESRELKSLNLGNQVTDAGLVSIAKLSGLVELFVTGPFTDAGLAHLIALRNIATLAIDSDYVSADGVSVVIEFPKMDTLYLDTPRLADDAIATLLRCSALETLNIFGSSLSDVGLQKLRDGLPRCSVEDWHRAPDEDDLAFEHLKIDQPRMDRDAPFLTLLAKACDLDLVEGTFHKIGSRYGHRVDATLYSPEESVIMLVWHTAIGINFAGFDYLFAGAIPGDPDFNITAEAYRTVGLDRDYQAFQEAFKLFPRGIVPDDHLERFHLFQESKQSARNQINRNFTRRGFNGSREKQLAAFIRKNAARLGDLDATS